MRGPSYTKTSHLPNFKVIHVQFIKEESSYISYENLTDKSVDKSASSVFLHRSEFETNKKATFLPFKITMCTSKKHDSVSNDESWKGQNESG